MDMSKIRDLIPRGSCVYEDVRHFLKPRVGDIRKLDMDPDFQRGHVWTRQQQIAFVGYFLSGGPVPPIFIQRYDCVRTGGASYWERPEVVLDGKQRLTAIQAFIEGEIPAQTVDGQTVWAKDFTVVDWRFLSPVQITYVDLTREEQLRFYLNLNRGGTVHTDEEIARVEALLEV